MTPHRAETVARYAAGNIRHALSIPVDELGALGAGIVAVLGYAFGAANVALLWIVGLAMLADLLAGGMLAVVDPLREFDTAKLYGGFLGKIFRLLIVPTVSLVDWLYIASPLPLPTGYEQAFPVTTLALIALAGAELTSALNKFRDGGVAPGVVAVIVRHLDRIRTGSEPPTRRHYDPPAIEEEIERGIAHPEPKDPS